MAKWVLKRLGKTIRFYRHKKKLTQSQLAYYAGLHRAYVGHVERGEKNISIVNLVRIADAMGVPPSELVSGIEKADKRLYFFSRRKRVVRKKKNTVP